MTAKALRGELDLAAEGTLILDDLPLLRPATMRALAETLDGVVTAQVVATLRPCPCGHLGDRQHDCGCTAGAVRRHRARVAAVLDRLDLIVALPALTLGELRARLYLGDSVELAPGTDLMASSTICARTAPTRPPRSSPRRS